MSTNARCPKCQSEINQTMQFCNGCQEPVNRETMQIAGMSVRIFVSILIFVMGTAYIGLLIFGALFSVPREVLLLIWFVVLAATIYFLLNGGKKSYSEREKFTQELRRREAERKSPTPEPTDENIDVEADTSVSPICTDCGKNNPPEAVHCMGCGKKLSQSTCPECETENLPEAKFCMGCGVKR